MCWLVLMSLSAWAQNAPTIGQLFVGDTRGQKPLQTSATAMDVVSGSQLSAGAFPSTLRLARGGEVVICPQSGLSVSTGPNGLMYAMGSGTIEFEYSLKERVSDTLLTPDFNVQLSGPGNFHFAIGVNKDGDTCIRPLRMNKTGITLSELMGTSVYRTNSSLHVLFPKGKLDAKPLTEQCGCSEPWTPPPAPVAVATAAPADTSAQPERVLVANNEMSPPPPPTGRPGQVHVQVDTPFIFNARNVKPVATAKIRVAMLPNVFFLQEKVDPIVLTQTAEAVSPKPAEPQQTQAAAAPPPAKKEKKGFMGRLKGFFGSMFHRK